MEKENLGFDTINLGHGSGGIMTRDLLDSIILKPLAILFWMQNTMVPL